MSDWSAAFFYFITGSAMLLSVVGLWFAALIPGIDRWSKRFFLAFFAVLLASGIAVLIEMALYYSSASNVMPYFVSSVETLLLSLPLPMQTVYLLHCTSESLRASKTLRAALGLWAVFFVLLGGASLTGGFIYATLENQYYRGPLYPLILAPLIAILLLNFTHTMRCRARLSRKAFLSFVVAQVPMAAALTVNLFVDAIPIFDISFVLSALAMYSFILSDQIEQDRRQQQEIARQQQEIAHERQSVLVLQMRPHFIYNTLMSIYSLCRTDPQKARQITLDFTNYLRSNFNAVASEEPVPFSTELEHTRAYLAVEQAQHDDMLVVDYDTPHTQFRLPPLTLQPLAENAVKHGLDPDSEPLHILVRTRRTEAGAEIVVEDTGPGFDPSEKIQPRTTLANIRQRLEMMCGGTLDIAPREGGGTVAKVTTPCRTERLNAAAEVPL